MILGWKIKAISLPQSAFTQRIRSRQQLAVLLFSSLCTHPAWLCLPSPLLHNCFGTTLNHFVCRFQKDAGGNGLQLYGIKANKTRVNLSVVVLWFEGIAGISGWATAPNVVDITPLFTSPCVLKYCNSDTENPFLFCTVLYTCLPFPLVLF